MPLHSDTQLDLAIHAVLFDGHQPDVWLTTAAVAEALELPRQRRPRTETVQQRLTLMLAERQVACRIEGGELVWRRSSGTGRALADAATWLNDDEALALQALRRFCHRQLLTALISPLQGLFDAAEARLMRSGRDGGNCAVAWHKKIMLLERTTPLIPPRLSDAVLVPVMTALFEERQLEVVYRPRNGRTQRKCLMPLGLIERASIVHLVALEADKAEPVCLQMDRVRSAFAMKVGFSYPDTFFLPEFVSDTELFGLKSKGAIQLGMRFKKGYGDIVRDAPLSADQRQEVGTDGSLIIHCTTEWNDRLVHFLRGFGPMVEVMAPLSLRRILAADARLLYRMYH
ncbi:YafY family protein [Cupriavidus sp. AU9028]|uniref:helix-turn-helix transcriptional regulator n=1 Tax=Cupriavidus sp. AU9028 TaxID=2871157 RepID=UPI001C93FFA5|nr:WYL domain-containing protein [Cupriavidus sp. AU9028]MBY4895420.1 WYL domain-containing protein [Cupriavidus sp. AU9028]